MIGSEPVLPTWGLVTDMNEFRLYWYDRGHQQSVRFVIQPKDLFQGRGLLGANEGARFDRFPVRKLFIATPCSPLAGSRLYATSLHGDAFGTESSKQLSTQITASFANTSTQRCWNTTRKDRPFPGTRGRLVRLAQKILDRLIFIFFCEDMGQALASRRASPRFLDLSQQRSLL
jgi:hypothetical protein